MRKNKKNKTMINPVAVEPWEIRADSYLSDPKQSRALSGHYPGLGKRPGNEVGSKKSQLTGRAIREINVRLTLRGLMSNGKRQK